MKVNFRDLAFKALWTAVQAAGAFLLVELADWRSALAVPIAAGLTYATGYARQRLGGEAPSDLRVRRRMRQDYLTAAKRQGTRILPPDGAPDATLPGGDPWRT